MSRTPGRAAPARVSFLLLVVLAALALQPAANALAAQAESGRKVTVRELTRMGFFQDFDELDLEDLLTPTDATVTVGSRHPLSIERTPGTVSLVKSEEIRELGARTLEDVLRLLPGVDVTTDRLGRSNISLRGIAPGFTGGASEGVLVLLDGQPLNEPVLGGVSPVNLSLSADHIRQVEVLRGPGSVLFGDGALGGIISITLESVDTFSGTELLAGGGSFGTQDYAIRSGARLKRLQVSGFVRFQDSTGARLEVPKDALSATDLVGSALAKPPISLAPGRTTDDYQTVETAYRFGLGEWSLGLRSRSDSSSGFVGFADALGRRNDLASRQTNVDLGWKREIPGIGGVLTRVAFAQTSIQQILEVYPSGYESTTPGGEVFEFGEPGGDGGVFLQNGLGSRRVTAEGVLTRDVTPFHQLTAGLLLGREATSGLEANANLDFRTGLPVPPAPDRGLGPLTAAVAESRRSVVSFFAQDAWTPNPKVTLTTGLRFDHHWGVGGRVSPRVALVGTLPAALEKRLPARLVSGLGYKLLYSRSFRVPTFAELYFRLPGFTGNPDLEAVVADSVEASLNYKGGGLQVAATGYWNLVSGTIETHEPFSPVGSFLLTNGPGVRVFGFEAEVRRRFGSASSAFANYAYQNARERDSGRPAAGVAAHLANLGASLSFRTRWSVTPTLELRSSRPRAASDRRAPVEGVALFGLSARARDIYRGLGADLLLQNLFDQAYADPAPLVPGDYPRPGRRVLLHLSYRF
ncbi:MAG TPA: TonB-dependent receptor [Vicinamibacteria bacterium]